MIYSVILFMVFMLSFPGVLSMSSVYAEALPQSRSVVTIASQKQFNEWQKESDHAEASGDYAAETNAGTNRLCKRSSSI
jgi:hypothetical protein